MKSNGNRYCLDDVVRLVNSSGKGLCFDDVVLRACEIECKKLLLDDVVLPAS